jgi:hypothetical protein
MAFSAKIWGNKKSRRICTTGFLVLNLASFVLLR